MLTRVRLAHFCSAIVVSSALTLAACSQPAAAAGTTVPLSASFPDHRVELYFGRSGPNGAVISPAAFADFTTEVIEPLFPNGFTLVQGSGHWRGAEDQPVDEETTILVVAVEAEQDGAAFDAKVETIRGAYISRFHQQGVLRVDLPARLSF